MPGTEPSLFAYLRLGLRAHRDRTALDAASRQVKEAGWDCREFLRVADAEHVGPLLYSVLRGRDLAPADVEAGLNAQYRRSAVRNALVFRELLHVLRLLAAVDVPAVLLKGAALALTVYEEPALRPMTDLDLLLHRGDMPRALAALRAEGYTMALPELGLAGAMEYTNEFVLSRPDGLGGLEIPVELHWGLFDSAFHSRKAAEAWLWEGALSFEGAPEMGAPVLVLRPEAQLLHLCGHLALHHAGEGPLWLTDIAEVIWHYRERIDWRVLLEQAQAVDLVLPLKQILPRVGEGWQAPIPAEVLAALAALEPSPQEARVYAAMSAGPRSAAALVWTNLEGLEGAGARLRYVLAKLFPAPAYMRQRYKIGHSALLPLYYPYRWLLGVRSALSLLTRPRHLGG